MTVTVGELATKLAGLPSDLRVCFYDDEHGPILVTGVTLIEAGQAYDMFGNTGRSPFVLIDGDGLATPEEAT